MSVTSISVAAPYVLFLLILGCVEAVVVSIGFYYFRYIQPLRARPLRVVSILVIVLAMNIAKYYLNVAGRDGCFRDIWLEATVGALGPTAFFWLAFRLFIIYSITKNRLEDRVTEGEDKKTRSRWTSILQPNLAKESTILILWFSWVFIFFLVPFIAYLSQVAKGEDPYVICDNKAISYSRILIIVMTVVLVCYMAYRLWNVHDGFWIKNELRAAAFGGLTVIPFFIANIIIDTHEFDQVVSIVFAHLNVFLITAVGVVPLVKAMKNYYHSSRTDSETSEMLESSKSGIALSGTKSNNDVEEEKEEEVLSFSKHPKVAKLVKDQAAKKFLEEYIIHFQKIEVSDYLIFWYQIRDFKALPKREFLTGKAYLLYSKYLKKDAYRFLPCITEEEQTMMDEALTKAMRASEPRDDPTDNVNLEQFMIDYDFFDAVLERVEDHLEENLFRDFFKSKFYKEYRQAISLNTGLQTVSV